MFCSKQLNKKCFKRKKSKHSENDLILYIDSPFTKETEIEMKEGYQEMAFLNLEMAMMTDDELKEVNDYENWLCGE
ncbi:hypothetical protein ACED96_14015 [Clostridium thermobutyricum]|uniref:Uncharacterized protein n=2 Tax=Clostridium thermobutyricum TaxID=29372 RepID=N9Y771_9CLOT|nr:hypothetical protein [Clostridium thermobutyricum]ENZ03622.1 hypothetical protein HMPREF1092_00156 [Clostridium thermobutyricum]OPX49375.1 hypothetical protein CLTHE_06690 [Clostridium thermobutyricum DSM 4928]